MDTQRKFRQLANYLDGQLLKLGITLGATKTVESTINTLITRPGFKILAWITFLTLVITTWIYQDRIEDVAENAKDKVEEKT